MKAGSITLLIVVAVIAILITATTPSLVYHVKVTNETEAQLLVFVVDAQNNNSVKQSLNIDGEYSFKLCAADSHDQVSDNFYLIVALTPEGEIKHSKVLKFIENKVQYQIAVK